MELPSTNDPATLRALAGVVAVIGDAAFADAALQALNLPLQALAAEKKAA